MLKFTARVDLEAFVLLDDLRLGCHSMVLGVGADITSYCFLITRVADRDAWFFRMRRVCVLNSLWFLIRKRML